MFQNRRKEVIRLGVPKTHIGDMIIPAWIRADSQYSTQFLRGLLDTDGCVTFQRFKGYEYTLLKFIMKNEVFANQVKSMLTKLGFHPFICRRKNSSGFDVVMRKKADLTKWVLEIGNSNIKNRMKLERQPLAAV